MSEKIYYFTGTGNSLAAAKRIARKLENAEVVSIAEAIKDERVRCDAETCGLVFPVYSWGPPAIVMRFIEKLEAGKETYIFAVCTCAGSPGGTLIIVKKQLERYGMELGAGYVIESGNNYIIWGGSNYEKDQKEKLAGAYARADQISVLIKEKKKSPVESSGFIKDRMFIPVYKLFSTTVAKQDKMFFADEKCNGCAICVKICPSDNISIGTGKPAWLHKCEQCLACIQFCPQKAIQCGKRSDKNKRYHHPDVTLAEMINR